MDETVTLSDIEKLEALYREALLAVPKIVSNGIYKEYPIEIHKFTGALAESPWVDYQYDVEEAPKIRKNIANADLRQLRCLLTYTLRMERFCEGYWSQALKDGYLDAVFERFKCFV